MEMKRLLMISKWVSGIYIVSLITLIKVSIIRCRIIDIPLETEIYTVSALLMTNV